MPNHPLPLPNPHRSVTHTCHSFYCLLSISVLATKAWSLRMQSGNSSSLTFWFKIREMAGMKVWWSCTSVQSSMPVFYEWLLSSVSEPLNLPQCKTSLFLHKWSNVGSCGANFHPAEVWDLSWKGKYNTPYLLKWWQTLKIWPHWANTANPDLIHIWHYLWHAVACGCSINRRGFTRSFSKHLWNKDGIKYLQA